MLHRVAAQGSPVHPKVDARRGEGGAHVAVDEGAELDDALEQGGRFRNGILVVTGLGAKDGSLQRPHVTDSFRAAELFYHQGVDRQDVDNREIVGQLFGQLLVKPPVAGD